MAPFYPTHLSEVPVTFQVSTHCDSIRSLSLAESAPVYPLTSIVVTAEGHESLRLATRDLLMVEGPWHTRESDRAELFVGIYRHVLANIASFHVSGRWLPVDSEWVHGRIVCSKGAADSRIALEASLPHVSDYVLLGSHRLRVTSAPDGRMVFGRPAQA